MLLFYQVATILSLTICGQLVELQDNNKSVELNNVVASCQQARNKQCEHILCEHSISTSLLQQFVTNCAFLRV
jgi:hypothetical protein